MKRTAFALALVAVGIASCDGREARPPDDDVPPLVVVEPIPPIDIPPPIEVECDGPVAVIDLIDVGLIEPFDTVRIDGSRSRASGSDVEGSFVGELEFALRQRPAGSTSAVFPNDTPQTELEVDLPGLYVVQLQVHEVRDGERISSSCEPATVAFTVEVLGDLVAILTWDHPTADLDLHTLREGGEPFTHEGDVYFSNREPLGAPWSDQAAENPVLAVDDNEGYGPEMTTLDTAIVGDTWTFAVHYWNSQTDGDAQTNARLRVYARGAIAFDETVTLVDDQVFWHGVEVRITEDAPEVTVIDSLAAFPRPF